LVSISRDGLLVVKRDKPFAASRERIVIPRSVADSFLAALHMMLDHPSRHQMKLGYLPFTWENRKFQLENQMVRAIPFGKLLKIWAVI